MSHIELSQLMLADKLFDEGELEEALELLNNNSLFEGLSFEKKSYFQYLKGLILFYQNKSQMLIELGELMLREGQKLKENLHSVDGLFFISFGLDLEKKFEEALKKIEQAETLLGLISKTSKKEMYRREFRLAVLKTMIDIHTGKMDRAEKSLEELLRARDELDNTWELLWAIKLMTFIKMVTRRNLDAALEYNEKAMILAKKLKYNHYWLGFCHLDIGVVYIGKCEYDMSLKHHMISLEYFEKINNIWFIANIYNNIGNLYCMKGEHDIALEYLEEAILLWEPYPLLKDACLDSLIGVSLDKGDKVRAQKYFQDLEDIYNEDKILPIEELYKFNKARLLKRSSRIRDRAKAEELFKEVLEKDSLYFETTIAANVNLCDLLLEEYRINNDDEVLEEIKQYINNLLNLAEKSQSYGVFCNTFILQAKLALLNFEIKTAQRFLTQAQKIAESYGIKRLAMKISYEHDELLRKSKMWEDLKISELSLSERLELSGLNEQMENMVKKRMTEVPEISKENPVMLLILTEGGNLLFSRTFVEDFSYEDDILGGFLTSINYFISEVFSEGLDRAVFGQYTLLMMPVQPFLACYIFKGHSYFAHHKLDNFIDSIQNNNIIWQSLQSFLQKSKSIRLYDIPSLESLISEIFVD